MQKVTAKKAQNAFGALIDTARREPVTIERYGRPVAVVLSNEEYERLEALDDAYWAARADKAAKEGFLSADETEAFFQEILNAEDPHVSERSEVPPKATTEAR